MKLLKTFAIATALTLGAGAAQAQMAAIATSNPGSIYHNIGTAIAKVANNAGMNTTLETATSPNQYIPVVANGEVDFGIANLQELQAATTGTEHFEGRPHPDLRVIGRLFPLRTAIFVRADSDIETMADLKGRPMPDGYTAQKTILPLLDVLYGTVGLTRADMEPVQVPSVVAGADAFSAGEADGFFFALGAGKVSEADAAVGGIRALPVANDDATVAKMKEMFPAGYLTEVQPGPAAVGVVEPTWLLAYPQLVFSSTNVTDDAAYQMAKILHEGKEGMVATLGAFKGFQPDEMVGDNGPVDYHPGAIRYFKEAGIWTE